MPCETSLCQVPISLLVTEFIFINSLCINIDHCLAFLCISAAIWSIDWLKDSFMIEMIEVFLHYLHFAPFVMLIHNNISWTFMAFFFLAQ